MTLPSFSRIVSASAGKVTANTTASATTARAKNFFMMTSEQKLVVEFCEPRREVAKRRDVSRALGESRGQVAEPSVIKNSARLPSLVFLSESVPQPSDVRLR